MKGNTSLGISIERTSYRSLYVALAALALAAVPADTGASTLPAVLAPPPPFPAIGTQAMEREAVAPGVERARYRLRTTDGPLVVSVVTVDLRVPSVRVDAVLAHDRVVSSDETTSSMALRTGAVAGINGDYFDLNGTGAPLGVLVRSGRLDRSAEGRPAVVLTRDRRVEFETFRFRGAISAPASTLPVAGVNAWPPDGGASVLTDAFGPVPQRPAGITVLGLLGTAEPRRYRVAAPNETDGLRLALGPAAIAAGAVPGPGALVDVGWEAVPPLADVLAAVGGGPVLLQHAVVLDDPASLNYAERYKYIPASAVALLANGALALVAVDGRRPATSVGVTRAQAAALLQGLGATDAMLLDGGGSTTLVGRVLGDAQASVLNEPSDGVERPVADGLFVYSDARIGRPSRLVVRPSHVVALPGARLALAARAIDAADHGLGEPRGPWRAFGGRAPLASIGRGGMLRAGRRLGSGQLRVVRGGLAGRVGVEVVPRVARLVLGPARVNPAPRSAVRLTVEGFDARDRAVATEGAVLWSARGAAIDPTGRLTTGDDDATVTARAGGITLQQVVPVGHHAEALDLFAPRRQTAWTFTTFPGNGSGSLAFDGGRLELGYDFTTGGRAAYATADIPLGTPLSLDCSIEGDGNGAALRAALTDRDGRQEVLTLVRAIDFTGIRRVSVAVPEALVPPLVLHSLYVVGTMANPPVTASGTVGIQDCSATFPGAGPRAMPAHTSPAANAAMPSARIHTGGALAIARAG